MAFIFYTALLCVLYTFLLYPLVIALLARIRRYPASSLGPRATGISIVLAVYKEEDSIARRLTELTTLISSCGLRGEIIVVSDGSPDATATIARTFTKGPVHVIELPRNMGKAAALNAGCSAAEHDIILFADVRQSWAPEAIQVIVEKFRDPSIGAVSGNLLLEKSPGVLSGVGLYWRYEKWIRQQESSFYSLVSVTGAISAVRRELFRPIPAGTILDDMYWPLQLVLMGYRVVHEPRARAFDRLPERPKDEFLRKARTLCGNYQLMTRLPAALLPWRNRAWFQYVSHKLLRLCAPWALLTMLLCCIVGAGEGASYSAALGLQVLFYTAGVLGLWIGTKRSRGPILSAASSFLVLNAAAWFAFWLWVFGKANRSWKKVAYEARPLGLAGPHMAGVVGRRERAHSN